MIHSKVIISDIIGLLSEKLSASIQKYKIEFVLSNELLDAKVSCVNYEENSYGISMIVKHKQSVKYTQLTESINDWAIIIYLEHLSNKNYSPVYAFTNEQEHSIVLEAEQEVKINAFIINKQHLNKTSNGKLLKKVLVEYGNFYQQPISKFMAEHTDIIFKSGLVKTKNYIARVQSNFIFYACKKDKDLIKNIEIYCHSSKVKRVKLSHYLAHLYDLDVMNINDCFIDIFDMEVDNYYNAFKNNEKRTESEYSNSVA